MRHVSRKSKAGGAVYSMQVVVCIAVVVASCDASQGQPDVDVSASNFGKLDRKGDEARANILCEEEGTRRKAWSRSIGAVADRRPADARSENFDWLADGFVDDHRLKDDRCIIGWAFALVGMFEAQLAKRQAPTPMQRLSIKQFVDCVSQKYFCREIKSLPNVLLNNVIHASDSLLFSEAAYPYTAESNTTLFRDFRCKVHELRGASPVAKVERIVGYERLKEDALMKIVRDIGPVVTTFNAAPEPGSSPSGNQHIFSAKELECSEEVPRHEVLVVGFGEEGDQKYWLIRGGRWKDGSRRDDLYRLRRGAGASGIAECALGEAAVTAAVREYRNQG